jgi:hypothetical protein
MIIIPTAMPASTELFDSLPSSFCIHLIIETITWNIAPVPIAKKITAAKGE